MSTTIQVPIPRCESANSKPLHHKSASAPWWESRLDKFISRIARSPVANCCGICRICGNDLYARAADEQPYCGFCWDTPLLPPREQELTATEVRGSALGASAKTESKS